MKRYTRVMLGKGHIYADACYKGNFIGADFGLDIDLTGKLPEDWKDFNQQFISIFMEKHLESEVYGLCSGRIGRKRSDC